MQYKPHINIYHKIEMLKVWPLNSLDHKYQFELWSLCMSSSEKGRFHKLSKPFFKHGGFNIESFVRIGLLNEFPSPNAYTICMFFKFVDQLRQKYPEITTQDLLVGFWPYEYPNVTFEDDGEMNEVDEFGKQFNDDDDDDFTMDVINSDDDDDGVVSKDKDIEIPEVNSILQPHDMDLTSDQDDDYILSHYQNHQVPQMNYI